MEGVLCVCVAVEIDECSECNCDSCGYLDELHLFDLSDLIVAGGTTVLLATQNRTRLLSSVAILDALEEPAVATGRLR